LSDNGKYLLLAQGIYEETSLVQRYLWNLFLEWPVLPRTVWRCWINAS